MDQQIKIKIADQEYNLKASTPDQEELIRKAASSINKKINAYMNRFPARGISDIIAFVALNESISAISLQRKLDEINQKAQSLLEDSSSYLEKNM